MELRSHPVGDWSMNAYVLICPQTRASVLIDPGADPETLLQLLAGSSPTAILLTHTHPDHIGALAEMRQRLQVPLMAHPGPHHGGLRLALDRTLEHGDRIPVGQHQLLVYHTPGHTPDMLCFGVAGGPDMVVGDTIFDGGPGKTWSVEDFRTTLQTLRTVVLGWPDETICHPGHGPSFRLADRRAAIEAFVQRDQGAFYGDASWEM